MIVYAAIYTEDEYDESRTWVAGIADNIPSLYMMYGQSDHFDTVVPFMLNSDEPVIRTADQARRFEETCIRCARKYISDEAYSRWFDENDTFLGTVEELFSDGSFRVAVHHPTTGRNAFVYTRYR